MGEVSAPKISICLPVLNARKYLNERWQSIRDQSFQDWELIVCDSQSDDGSWEYLRQIAVQDARVTLHQTPRNGIYAGINDCIQRSRGAYIYIATADDTMLPSCLELMVKALEQNPDCGICQCGLEIIDEVSRSLPSDKQWQNYTLGMYNPELVFRSNKRFAPHDGLLYPGLLSIYTSLTQLLIKSSVFKRCGLFENRWGAISDFEWGMRVGLIENCIYVPDKLATWRLHSSQATDHLDSYVRREQMLEMVYSAINKSSRVLNSGINKSWSKPTGYILERDLIQMRLKDWKSQRCGINMIINEIIRHPRAFLGHIKDIFLKKYWGQWHHQNRYKMINQLLQFYDSKKPVFMNIK